MIAVGHGITAFWYFTRAAGLIALILLSATVVLGIIASIGWTAERWPRFVSQTLHRNLSLFCITLVALHVVTTVADGYVPIGLASAVIPFLTPYRPLWVGMGAVTFDLLLTVAITSGLRRRIGVRAWRGVHYLAYVCWPIAVLHGLGSGTDARLPLAIFINVVCIASVVGAVAWRLVAGRSIPGARRAAAAGAAAATLVGIAAFALIGPLQPGWSRRSGTSSALLAQLNASFAATTGSQPSGGGSTATTTVPSTSPSSTTAGSSSTSALPATPFSSNVSGTLQTSGQNSAGQVQVLISLHLAKATVPLTVSLIGTAVSGGVAMTSSRVTFGKDSGAVTALNGSSIAASVRGTGGTVDLTMQLNIDQSNNTVTGTVSGTTGSGR
jgi:sulfoxide reductase heme-binding subunit YedZ